MSEAGPPRVFISYAWSHSAHNQRVERLATELRAAGVDVIFDRWDLEEGHDLPYFMERMVNDTSISRVLIILNSTYTEKANARRGGVGTEALIMSPEVYTDPLQTRYLPVVFEQVNGQAVVPTFLRSRLYFDLSTDERWAEAWERLLLTLHGVKPGKPPLGPVPQMVLKAAGQLFSPVKQPPDGRASVSDSYKLIYTRLHDLFSWYDLDQLQAAGLLAPFGFTLAALSQPERTLELLTEEVVDFLSSFFQVTRGFLLGRSEDPGMVAGYWYKDVRPLCSRIVALHSADELQAVRFVTAQGSRVVNPKARYRESLEEDVIVVLVLKRKVGSFEFKTYEVWETGTWTYQKCRLDLKTILLFCEQVAERRLLLQVAGGTFKDPVFEAVRDQQTHIAQVVGKGSWGLNWHPTDYVSSLDHLAKERAELPAVAALYSRAGLEALSTQVPPRSL